MRSTWYSALPPAAPPPAACKQSLLVVTRSGLGLLVGLGGEDASLQVELEVPPSQRSLMHHGEGGEGLERRR